MTNEQVYETVVVNPNEPNNAVEQFVANQQCSATAAEANTRECNCGSGHVWHNCPENSSYCG